MDIWTLPAGIGSQIRWLPWTPIDHDPIPKVVLERAREAYLVLPYSRWGERLLREAGIRTRYIPHGVETSIFRPLDKQEARKKLGLKADYLFGMVAANVGFPSRKCFDRVLEAFSIFKRKHRDAKLYIHSWPGSEWNGPDLLRLVQLFGLDEDVSFPNPYRYMLGFSDEEMAWLYNSFDCLLMPSMAEGFGIPLIEAQACGVPVIATDFSAMTENVGSGWLVPWRERFLTLLYSWQVLPSIDGILDAMENAYNHQGDSALAQAARDFALAFDYDRVVQEYWKPLLDELRNATI